MHLLDKIAGALAGASARRACRNELDALSDAILRDIGLTRCDAPRIARETGDKVSAAVIADRVSRRNASLMSEALANGFQP